MCRELITPNFDITPEMMTHTFVVDPDTCEPQPDWSGSNTIGRHCRLKRRSGFFAISAGLVRFW